jgi:hypothetical protein
MTGNSYISVYLLYHYKSANTDSDHAMTGNSYIRDFDGSQFR